jgi:phthalate 4,5-cis-dihydrodiol dehydrogenase
VKLLVGHTNSFEVPLRAMRKLVLSGELGRLRAVHIWSYTDWMLRPRTPDELDPARGGGVPYRQGSHQIDVVRLLGGGLLRSVRGTTGEWMPERSIPGYHCAYLEFEDGTPATILHNGYGYSLTAEYYPWARERLRYSEEDRLRIRKGLKSGLRDDAADKQEYQIGRSGDREAARASKPAGPEPWTPADLGMVVVSCERGDIRNVQYGISVDGDEGRREIDLTSLWAPGPWRPGWELKELYEAVALGRPVYHSGAWGLATVEATVALIQSGRERREIMLRHQVPMPLDYDADLGF